MWNLSWRDLSSIEVDLKMEKEKRRRREGKEDSDQKKKKKATWRKLDLKKKIWRWRTQMMKNAEEDQNWIWWRRRSGSGEHVERWRRRKKGKLVNCAGTRVFKTWVPGGYFVQVSIPFSSVRNSSSTLNLRFRALRC